MTQKPSEREMEIARKIVFEGPWPGSDIDGKHLPVERLALYFMRDRPFRPGVCKNLQWAIEEALAKYRVEVLEKERAAIIAILDSKRFYLGGGEGELADAIRERNNE